MSSDIGILERNVVCVLALDVDLVVKMDEEASRFGSAQAWRRGTVTQEQSC